MDLLTGPVSRHFRLDHQNHTWCRRVARPVETGRQRFDLRVEAGPACYQNEVAVDLETGGIRLLRQRTGHDLEAD
ncbi:hypothetical protein QW131_07785 [Roseibium salinum]|nr:hypothetical protein [Roseibium salinum]